MDIRLSTGKVLSVNGLMIPMNEYYNAYELPVGPERDAELTRIWTAADLQRKRHDRMRTAEADFVNNAPLQYGSTCYTTNPCRHEVTLNNQPKGTWQSTTIAEWFLTNEWPIPPHFQYLCKVKK